MKNLCLSADLLYFFINLLAGIAGNGKYGIRSVLNKEIDDSLILKCCSLFDVANQRRNFNSSKGSTVEE